MFEPPISYPFECSLPYLFSEAVAVCQCHPLTQSHSGCYMELSSESITHVAVFEPSQLFLYHEAVAVCQCQPQTQSQRGCNRDIISESIRQVAVFEVPISYPNKISSLQFLFHKVVAMCQCRL